MKIKIYIIIVKIIRTTKLIKELIIIVITIIIKMICLTIVTRWIKITTVKLILGRISINFIPKISTIIHKRKRVSSIMITIINHTTINTTISYHTNIQTMHTTVTTP